MTKREFIKKMFQIASNINDTDKGVEIIKNIDDAERLVDNYFKEICKRRCIK